jgi:hypothetical protein
MDGYLLLPFQLLIPAAHSATTLARYEAALHWALWTRTEKTS